MDRLLLLYIENHSLGGWDSSLSRALSNSDRIMDVQVIKTVKGGSALT